MPLANRGPGHELLDRRGLLEQFDDPAYPRMVAVAISLGDFIETKVARRLSEPLVACGLFQDVRVGSHFIFGDDCAAASPSPIPSHTARILSHPTTFL